MKLIVKITIKNSYLEGWGGSLCQKGEERERFNTIVYISLPAESQEPNISQKSYGDKYD